MPWEDVEREGVWVTKWLRGRELREELGWGGSQQQPGSKEMQGMGS